MYLKKEKHKAVCVYLNVCGMQCVRSVEPWPLAYTSLLNSEQPLIGVFFTLRALRREELY